MKAFPWGYNGNTQEDGMELEDYFAAKAMQTLLMQDPQAFHRMYMDEYKTMLEGVADLSYQMSAEMMKARRRHEGT